MTPYISRILDVASFIKFTSRLSSDLGWMFRGQASGSWDLLPKAGRKAYYNAEHEARRVTDSEMQGMPPHDLGRFNAWRHRAIAYARDLPNNDFECLACAQHHGLATRLLDWSQNPLVALFFACESASPEHGAVWAYFPNLYIDDRIATISGVPEVAAYVPRPINNRILSQQGRFTYHPSPSEPLSAGPIDSKLDSVSKIGTNLAKIEIIAEMKPIILHELNALGVARHTLFQDLDGLSEYINWGTRRFI